MCRFKSGIILKNKIILAPEGNESHSDLLEKLNIKDNHMNAAKKFVRAELIPPNDNKAEPIDKWRFNVDQDITPDWFDADPQRYESEFRDAVKEYLKDKFVVICGYAWNAIKSEGNKTWYLMNGFLEKSEFGKNNNYANSYVREKLNNSELLEKLKAEFGDKLVPITTDLLSLDGLDDYGKVKGDFLAIPTIDLYRECRKQILKANSWWWLATPDSTPSGYGSGSVRYVGSDGCVGCGWYDYVGGVRPFFILES